MALPQECLISLARKYGMEIKGYVSVNPEDKERVSIHLDKVLVIPELGTVKNEFHVGVRIVNWKKKAEKYGKKPFKPYNYEVNIHISTSGYETFWASRTFTGDDIYALMKQACSAIEKYYDDWMWFLERKKERITRREERKEEKKEGLWKWLCLIPIAGMFLFRRR